MSDFMNKKNYIIGYSGHAYVVIDVLLSIEIFLSGYCEKSEKKNNPYELDFLGDESDLLVLDKIQFGNVYLGIGKNSIRKELYEQLSKRTIQMPFAAHKNAIVSRLAYISEAAIIMPGAILNSHSYIGRGVICNSASVIEHECTIGDFSHIAPGAVLAGGVTVGTNSFIGANAVIKEGVKIGNNVIVGAGSVIINDILNNFKVVGNPQKIID